jgi:inosine-uridine nucleoside N-ribohydrolase
VTLEKILLDTDIGSDIDDTVALAYLLRHPRCDLLGITTASGEPAERAKCASALCIAAGRGDMPIYPGTENPLLIKQKQPDAHQKRYLRPYPHAKDFPKGEAIEFMRRTIRGNPGEVTLLGIGPMTNIGLLFAADPEIPLLLKQLVLMGGVFTYRYMGETCLSEWNIRCDPHAAAMMYNAPVRRVVSIGLDVTGQVVMEKEEAIPRLGEGLLKVVLDFSGLLDGDRQRIIFHDPLAAAAIFEPGLFTFAKGNIEVELSNGRLEGLTHWQPDEKGRNEVAVTVDREGFLAHYFSIVS